VDVINVMLQKPRLNVHHKKQFRKLVAEMATLEDVGTEIVTDTLGCDLDYVESCNLIDQGKNSLTSTATDFNCNVTQLGTTSQM